MIFAHIVGWNGVMRIIRQSLEQNTGMNGLNQMV